jgi:hypothetical protein
MDLTLAALVFIGSLTLGIGIGILLTEILRVRELMRQIVEMRKAGFIPNYSIQNERDFDPTDEISEY